MFIRRTIASGLLGLSAVLLAATASAVPITVNVDTTTLAGSSAQLAFDFIDGGAPANSITVSDFTTTGTLGASATTGSVSGTLPGPVILTDLSFFNEYLADIALGTSFSFVLNATTNAPDAGSFPDSFSFFLLDSTTGLPLVTTADPTGANALLKIDIDGSPTGDLEVFPVAGDGVLVGVSIQQLPTPGSLLLVVAGLAGMVIRRQRPLVALNLGNQ